MSITPTSAAPPSRYWAFFPVLTAAAVGIHYIGAGRPAEMLWICNVSILALGLGLLLRSPIWVRSATLWLVAGTPIWLFDAAVTGVLELHSPFTHLGGSALGLWALRHLPASPRCWWRALLAYLGLQLICRLFTPATANVNIAFEIYPVMQPIFSSYGLYWLTNLAIWSAIMPLLERVLERVFGWPSTAADPQLKAQPEP